MRAIFGWPVYFQDIFQPKMYHHSQPAYQTFNGTEFRPYPRNCGQIVVLAGAEGSYFRKLMIDMKVKACLLSYFYLRQKLAQGQEKMGDIIDDLRNFDFVIMDSGGFTLQKTASEGRLNLSLHEFLAEYYAFAREYRRYFTFFGAVDSTHKESGFTVEDMFRGYWDSLDHKIHVAPTIFGQFRARDLEREGFFRHFDVLGMNTSGLLPRNLGNTRQTLIKAAKYGTRVHGYALTKQDDFLRYNFASVDSLTWLGGQKYGSTYVFRAGKMRTYGLDYKKRIRPRLKQLCVKEGIDHAEVMKDNYKEVNKINLVAWRDFGDSRRGATKGRAYWLKNIFEVYDMDGNPIEPQNNDSPEDILSLLAAKDVTPEETEDELPDEPEIPAENTSDSMPALSSGNSVAETDPRFPGLPIQTMRRKLPMRCDNCNISDRCPKFKEKSECSFTFGEILEHGSIQNKLKDSVDEILRIQFERVVRGSVFERMDGGVIDPQLSTEITRYMSLLQFTKSLTQEENSFTIKGTGTAATVLAAAQAPSVPAGGGGLLQNLLQNLSKK